MLYAVLHVKLDSVFAQFAKIKEMPIKFTSNGNMIFNNQTIERVTKFRYLGNMMATNSNAITDLEARSRKAGHASTHPNKDWRSILKTKLRIFIRYSVISVLLYEFKT